MRKSLIKLLVITSLTLLVLGIFSACGEDECRHSSLSKHIIEPTCTEAGYTYYECDNCGYSYREEGSEVKAKGHTPEVVQGEEPTCAQFGYTDGKKCSVCNTVLEERVQIPKLKHNNIVQSIVDATCNSSGYTVYFCIDCEAETKGDYISAKGHTPMTEAGVKPTCTDGGTTDKTYCGDCGAVISDHTALPASGHSYGKWTVVKNPTEDSTGTASKICSFDSSHVETFDLPVLSKNNYRYSVTKEADCTENGNERYVYAKDGQDIEINIAITATGHSYGKWQLSVNPTRTSTGTLTKTCSNNSEHTDTCTLPSLDNLNYVYTLLGSSTCSVAGNEKYVYEKDGQSFEIISELPLLAHTVVNDPERTATCTATGLTAGTHCSVCYTVITAQEVIPKVPHKLQLVQAGYAAQCEKTGVKDLVRCWNCNTITQYADVIPALGHVDSNNDDNCDRCGTLYGKNVKNVYSVSDLQGIANNLSGKYLLKNNIDLNGVSWTPLGTFSGVLDGNGYTISNLSITQNTNSGFIGFFGTVNGATVRNLKFANVYIKVTIPSASNSSVYAGTVAGRVMGASTEIKNVEIVSGSVSAEKTSNNILGSSNGEATCGGLFGHASENIHIEKCINRASIKALKGSARAGGIIGECEVVRVESCTNYGAVTASATTVGGYDYAGGIVGKCNNKNASTFNFCVNSGTISTLGGSDIHKYSGDIYSNG